MGKKKQLATYKVAVSEDEAGERAISISEYDRQGNEVFHVLFALETAKEVAYRALGLIYKIEHGLSIPGERRDPAEGQETTSDGEEE